MTTLQPTLKTDNHRMNLTQYPSDISILFTIPFESWQLLWTLTAINISSTGVVCRFDVKDAITQRKSEEFETLIEAQPSGIVQINPSNDSYFCPTLPAKVIQTTRHFGGLELTLQFLNEQTDLDTLMMTLTGEQCT